jgi:hypothetical protein
VAKKRPGPTDEFHVSLYKTTFIVSHGKALTPEGLDYQPEATFGHNKSGLPVLWFLDLNPPPGLVAHECLHAAVWLLSDKIGTTVQTGARHWEEPLAYLLEYMVAECVAALARIRQRGRARRKKRQ